MSITAANAQLSFTQAVLFPTPVLMSGFAVDDIYDIAQAQITEELMGADGTLSFGFIYTPRVQNITLQADSPSNAFFDTIAQQQTAAVDVYPLNGVIRLPGISIMWNMINGALRNYAPAPDAKRTLTPRRYTVSWARVFPAPM
jgi:hypothetical protein